MATIANQASSEVDVEYLQGIHLVDSVLWMDAPRQVDLSFISHAHVDRVLAHGKVLTTEATARLAPKLQEGSKTLISPFHRRIALGGLDLEIHPAGHILGSAQLRVTRDGRRLVYTGHHNLQATRTAEQARVLSCDVLVLDSRYGSSRMRFPPRQQVEEDILSWIGQTLDDRAQPVLLGRPLGTAQEIASLLGASGFSIRVHRSIYEYCKVYHGLGMKLPGVKRFRGTPGRDEVVIFPRQLVRSRAVEKLPRARLALVSGLAAVPEAAQRLKVDRAFALSSLADHPELVRYARESGAKKIYVVGAQAEALATDLRGQGLRAWPLRPPQQLDLFLAAN